MLQLQRRQLSLGRALHRTAPGPKGKSIPFSGYRQAIHLTANILQHPSGRASITELTTTPVTGIVNMGYCPNHAGGNATISAAPRSDVAYWRGYGILSHKTTLIYGRSKHSARRTRNLRSNCDHNPVGTSQVDGGVSLGPGAARGRRHANI